RHDLPASAGLQPFGVLAVKGLEARAQVGRPLAVTGRAVRVELAEPAGQSLRQHGEPGRIQPEMRVYATVVVDTVLVGAVVSGAVVAAGGAEVHLGTRVQGLASAFQVHHGIDLRLEPG